MLEKKNLLDPRDFGERFLGSKFARPYRYKSRKARTNFRSSNKKKIHQYL